MDIAGWLRDLGLGEYAPAFCDNAIDADVLCELTAEDLKDLGVTLVGHRRKLLAAIAQLREQQSTAPARLDHLASPSAAAPPVATPEADARRSPSAERRQLTVMFVDLVGSTALAARLDPEEMRQVLRAYQNGVAGEVARFDGHVAKFMGDGVLAYFGWPRAHEDDAERAVRAGLAIAAAVAGLEPPRGERLQGRIGIATGLVVVGDLIGEGASQEEAVVGETPNLAARLQALAHPGQVVVAESTRRLLRDVFALEDLGRHALKGMAAPVPAFAVLRERALESRFAAHSARAMLPLIGREHELALLLERWRLAAAGEGQMVLLTGEAGIGKSRIAEGLIDALANESHIRLRYQCSPYHTDSALYPVVQQLTLAAGLEAGQADDEKLDRLEALLAQAGVDPAGAAPLFAALLGLDGSARYGPLELTPQQQRTRTLQALVEQLVGLADQKPVLFLIEDAHWIDPTTLELVELSLDAVAEARVLLVITARPTFAHGFGGHPIVTRLALNRLGRDQVAAIVARITAGKALPGELLDEIAAKTDGVPLFVEEMTKAVLESGLLREAEDAWHLTAPLSSLAIPTTLHDSLMARLDRLQPVKEVAQNAAVIGRAFDYRTIAALSSLPEGALRHALDRLVEAELVFRRGNPPEASYLFKHALVRDAAYESLLKSRRQALHARLLEILEGTQGTAFEILAHHAQEAGRTREAIDYWQKAGEQALGRPAYKEAIGHFEQAIRLLGEMDGQRQWQERELALQIQLGQAAIGGYGYAAERTAGAFARAQQLADELGDTPLRFPALYGQWAARYIKGEPSAELAARFLALAEEAGDTGARLVALRTLALERFHSGRFAESLELVEQILAAYEPKAHHHLALQYGHDARAAGLIYKSWSLWFLGFADQAAAMSAAALDWAIERDHPNTTGHVLCWGGLIPMVLRRDIDLVEERGRHALAVASELAALLWGAWSRIFLGWAQVHRGEHAAGVGEIARGLTEAQTLNAGRLLPWLLALAAEAQALAGEAGAARSSIARAFAAMESKSDRAWAVELHCIRAAVAPERAEADLVAALGIAREQGARLPELRAAIRLARHWAERGERGRGHDLLAPLYAWFTEGFHAPDLIEAKALLGELR